MTGSNWFLDAMDNWFLDAMEKKDKEEVYIGFLRLTWQATSQFLINLHGTLGAAPTPTAPLLAPQASGQFAGLLRPQAAIPLGSPRVTIPSLALGPDPLGMWVSYHFTGLSPPAASSYHAQPAGPAAAFGHVSPPRISGTVLGGLARGCRHTTISR